MVLYKITKAVIPAAGLGTRLLPATKEQPKEMLPIFVQKRGVLLVKPIVQVVFEQLYEIGLREFYFIVGRNKRAVEDHFTPDYDYLDRLNANGKVPQADGLQDFYHKLESSTVAWINQPFPRGFGHAVSLTKNLIKDEVFLVHAGDTVIFSQKNRHLSRLLKRDSMHKEYCKLLVREVEDPRPYGVIEAKRRHDGMMKVAGIEEKPVRPKTNLAIMPVYIFDPIIFKALESIRPDARNEIQLTDGIKKIIDLGHDVVAHKLKDTDIWLDVGSPETYWEAQYASYSYFKSSSGYAGQLQ